MMKHAYMVIGCPGSGKSWVCEQLQKLFEYVHHDLFIGMAGGTYVNAILRKAKDAEKPLLIEAPFSVSQIRTPLMKQGISVHPFFIIEQPEVIADRYLKREKKQIPPGHLTRQRTYEERAKEWGSFMGTSSEVYARLKGIGEQA